MKKIKNRGYDLPQRFIFRQVDYRDLQTFLSDGCIRAKNHAVEQRCHQTSEPSIVDRRGTAAYAMPCGGVVNDYVPFYFSPITAYSISISYRNVDVYCPQGRLLGKSDEDDRIFFVSRPERIRDAGLQYCFSNIALNRADPSFIKIERDLNKLETHINWLMFDEPPPKGAIPQINYDGSCKWCFDANANGRMNRRQERMAEFLVRTEVPLGALDCIVVKSQDMKDTLQPLVAAAGLILPIHVSRGCYRT